jgi:hypothetical protein
VAPDGSRKPWPAAPLQFTFDGVTDLRFDAEDRHGVTVASDGRSINVSIGRNGVLRATKATVWPNDPRWHESVSGRAADAVTPHTRPRQQQPVSIASLTSHERGAARALTNLMLQIRLVDYYPHLAARIPVREICRTAADAGTAILTASEHRGAARQQAFAELEQRWRRVPPENEPASIPSGPALLRYASYNEPHNDYDIHRDGSAVLVAAAPDTDPSAPWRLVSQEMAHPAGLRITTAAFDGVQNLHHDVTALTISDHLVIQPGLP